MPLGTIDRTPPPFFKQGPSALSRLTVCSALALALMVVDARLHLATPLRAAVATALYPLQWLVLQPVHATRFVGGYFTSLQSAQSAGAAAQEKLALQAMRAAQVEVLALENQRLRELLALNERLNTPTVSAEVLYDAGDPYTRKLVINRGTTQDVVTGSPVLDGDGVLGQVTRAYPLVAEVTLLTDRSQAIPVLNTRTGVRGVAYGLPGAGVGAMELRFTPANADVEVGDLLATSGVDGVYPPGLPVARVQLVERRPDAIFARVECEPLAGHQSARHVLVVSPAGPPAANALPPEPASPTRRGARSQP